MFRKRDEVNKLLRANWSQQLDEMENAVLLANEIYEREKLRHEAEMIEKNVTIRKCKKMLLMFTNRTKRSGSGEQRSSSRIVQPMARILRGGQRKAMMDVADGLTSIGGGFGKKGEGLSGIVRSVVLDGGANHEETKENEQILTGILYLDPDSEDTHEILGTIETPLNTLGEKELCPGNEVLQTFNESLR